MSKHHCLFMGHSEVCHIYRPFSEHPVLKVTCNIRGLVTSDNHSEMFSKNLQYMATSKQTDIRTHASCNAVPLV